ncbi:hypothetical protein [Salinicola sp. DM10]|uniref:hypothetical protein n=1 Tax=Salinicola sp. DM10 TaxID=2815721 RepID=UPI001A908DF1|nr:hypothetical protein [Salinicola sp. DM10]MCE3028575.1 hypothetical protein [Salinicola sp. DM10]
MTILDRSDYVGAATMRNFEGFVFLNIDNFACAWNTYIGCIHSADAGLTKPTRLAVSSWLAFLLKDRRRFEIESLFERVRQAERPGAPSRMRGFFVIEDMGSAVRILDEDPWGCHFCEDFITDVGVSAISEVRVDSNWFHYYEKLVEQRWDATDIAKNYWSGKPYADRAPIWETIVDGEIMVWGEELRKHAFENIKSRAPQNIPLLEVARVAHEDAEGLGETAAFVVGGHQKYVNYFINFDATDDKLASLFHKATVNGQINPVALKGFEQYGLVLPDLSNEGFEIK